MFKLNIYVKFALIAVFLGGGILCAIFIGFWWALPLILIGIGLLASYFLLGTIQSAGELMQTSQFDAAEERLKLTIKPEWLYSANKAYYYIIRGTLAMQRKDNAAGEMWLKKAQEVDIPTDNEKAMVEIQLANIAAMKNKWKQAALHIRAAKQLKITEPMIKEQLAQFDRAMQGRGQQKAAMSMGKQGMSMMRQGKGKRRRPKMR